LSGVEADPVAMQGLFDSLVPSAEFAPSDPASIATGSGHGGMGAWGHGGFGATPLPSEVYDALVARLVI
jgi:hypothetical protein